MKKTIPLKEALLIHSPGLSAEVAAQKLKRLGKNEILEDNSNSYWELIIDTLKDPMIWFLLLVGGNFSFYWRIPRWCSDLAINSAALIYGCHFTL